MRGLGASRALAFIAVSCITTACPEPEPLCDLLEPLVTMDGFALVAAVDDPFDPPAEAHLCEAAEVRAEPFGNGPVALDVDTNGQCGWATVRQPTLLQLAKGDDVLIKIFYFTQLQTAFPEAEAQLAIRIGEEVVWTQQVAIPTDGDLIDARVSPQAADAGTPFFFHLGNHGTNTWSLLEVLRLRRVACSALEDADGGSGG